VQEQTIRELCRQLLACRSDAVTARLARALRAALHEYIEQTRGTVLVLPLRHRNDVEPAKKRVC